MNRRTAALLVVAVVVLAMAALLLASLLKPSVSGKVTDQHRVASVAFKHYPNHGHFTDHMCVYERNHGKYEGSCQSHYRVRVTDVHRACHACHGKDELPCHPWHPGMVCTGLLHADLYSWGLTYSIHELVRFYYDGWKTWANRTYRGWHGWQKCWSGFSWGATIDDLECDGRFYYRWDGAYRLQATDWFYRYKTGLWGNWLPISRTYEVNGRHWPYPSPAEIWMS